MKPRLGDKILKVIIETCLLTDEKGNDVPTSSAEASADYIKTAPASPAVPATMWN